MREELLQIIEEAAKGRRKLEQLELRVPRRRAGIGDRVRGALAELHEGEEIVGPCHPGYGTRSVCRQGGDSTVEFAPSGQVMRTDSTAATRPRPKWATGSIWQR